MNPFKGVIEFAQGITTSLKDLIFYHRFIGWLLLLVNFAILISMTYHIMRGWGRDILEAEDYEDSQIATNKWQLLYGERGYLFIFAVIFQIFLVRATVKYIYNAIEVNAGENPRDLAYIRALMDNYQLGK
ncbi:MAG: hypothetical protein CMB64_04675 [Euryarchaeota archaeon]|nr:hypothetical protein [Euryarchaeota archaeon]|tara:strand:+ start:1631 stop:2020 length:390 start_codon:yes stop_codon:yes gene_type:complete